MIKSIFVRHTAHFLSTDPKHVYQHTSDKIWSAHARGTKTISALSAHNKICRIRCQCSSWVVERCRTNSGQNFGRTHQHLTFTRGFLTRAFHPGVAYMPFPLRAVSVQDSLHAASAFSLPLENMVRVRSRSLEMAPF